MTKPDESSVGAVFTTDRVLTLALLIATALAFYLCWLIAKPFMPALAWAVALAVVGTPMHRWIRRRIRNEGVAAGAAVTAIAIVVVAPAFFLLQRVVMEGTEAVTALKREVETGAFRQQLMQNPQMAQVVTFVEENFDLASSLQQVAGGLSGPASSFVSGSIWAIVELLIVFFSLFYFFRDRDAMIAEMRGLVPLARDESTRLLKRLSDTVQATVFGTLVVAAIQGTLGGLMFWWLGLPLPLLWGVVMGLLAIIPVLGAFVIWIPAAILLVIQGSVIKALILTVWGVIVIGLIDNLLYPMLVGNRLRLHTLPVFFSIVGGLLVFGASGLIIGPVVLSVADGLVNVWRHRMAVGEVEG
ncbi:MAG TPA: AI-2E family transporter [Candidatus Kapabacteria bacterium]|nr:AI-2E family transporter [Candidatus Kapabacteria bacterium]